MAQYDRRILIPYLQDICSIELLCTRIAREINSSSNQIRNYNAKINRKIVDPEEPKYSDFEPEKDLGGDFAVLAWEVFFICIGLWLMRWVFFLGLIPLGIAAIMICGFASEGKKSKENTEKKYQYAMNTYRNNLKQNEIARNSIPKYRNALKLEQQKLSILQNRLTNAQSLRKNLYDINVIPKQYRNIYAAYYLYDYFSTCRENDLDKIIQTMLLDEIKQKLDQIIVQNEQILLNQRIQLALQEQQNQLAADHRRTELEAIARMERNQELQLDYQNMITQNQVVTNFLLAADYLYR